MDPENRQSARDHSNVGVPRRAWQFTGLANERDRPALAKPHALVITDVLSAFGWRESRADPRSTRDTDANVLQPALLANGTLGARIIRLDDTSAFTELALRDQPVEQLVRELFLRILSRPPSETELARFRGALEPGYDAAAHRSARPGTSPRRHESRLVGQPSQRRRDERRPRDREGSEAPAIRPRSACKATGASAWKTCSGRSFFRRNSSHLAMSQSPLSRRDFLTRASLAAGALERRARRRSAPNRNRRSARRSTASSSGSAAACRRATPSTASRPAAIRPRRRPALLRLHRHRDPRRAVLRAPAARGEDVRSLRPDSHGQSQRDR